MNYLKEIRIEHNYSCADMGKMLQISKTFYWQIENKKRSLSYEMAIKISNIFNLKPDDIFYDTKKSKN